MMSLSHQVEDEYQNKMDNLRLALRNALKEDNFEKIRNLRAKIRELSGLIIDYE